MNREVYSEKFNIKKNLNPIYEQALEIAEDSGLEATYILKMFIEVGPRATREIWQEAKGVKELFKWLYKKEREKIVWEAKLL